MKKITSFVILWLGVSSLMLTNLNAQETTDNLLNNNSFTTDTSGWELSDNNQDKVKRDPNTYSNSASKSMRFRYQGGSISQDVDVSGIPENHVVKEIHMDYQGIGCGNTGNQWCTAGADDTIVSTITLSATDSIEIIQNISAIPYEDGWADYSFSEEVIGTFNTNDLDVNLNIVGNDTGNSSSWFGPIIDNINLSFTIEEYVEPIVEPIIQQITEVVEEETMIGGLDLSTEVTLDLIQDVPTLPSIGGTISEIPDIPDIEPIEVDMPELIDVPLEIDMPTPIPEIQVEMPIDIPEIAEIQPIQEIAEIEPQQPEMAGAENEGRKIEPETEGQIEVAEAKAETGGELSEPEPDTSTDTEEGSKESSGESKANADKGGEPSDTTEVAATDSKEDRGDSRDSKSKPKSKAKGNAKADRPTSTAKKKISKPKATLPVNTSRPKTIAQLPLPIAYLQNITESITLVETISLQQEMIYGGQQVDNLNTSSITIIALDNNSSSRWSNLQNESKRFKAPKYSR